MDDCGSSMDHSTVTVMDLTEALRELREVTLIACAWIDLANRAALDGQSPAYVQSLVARSEEAARSALARVRLLDEAASLAVAPGGLA